MIKLPQKIFINFIPFNHTLAISAINQTIFAINIMIFSFLNRIEPCSAILRAFLYFYITCINMIKIFGKSYLLVEKTAILFLARHLQKISLWKLNFSYDSGLFFIIIARWTNILSFVLLLKLACAIWALQSYFALLAHDRFICQFFA